MKYLLLLALVGCATANLAPTPTPSLPEPPSTDQSTLGFDSDGEMGFTCYQSEVTPALVWDECHFHNFSDKSREMCLTLSYRVGGARIATSRELCSGPLDSGQTKDNYAAFIKTDRKVLEENCGPNMIRCTLTAEVTK